MRQPAAEVVLVATGRVLPRLVDITRHWRTVLRSGAIGTTMGIIPGVGEGLGAWASYAAARRASRERAAFGKGSLEGLMAAGTGNDAAVPGAVIRVLMLAVPGSAPAAVLLAAMFIHGVRPGPLIMIEFPTFISEVVAMMLLAGAGILIYGLLLTRPLLYVLAVPRERLMPLIFVLCTIGSFAIASRLFDVYVMLAFGLLGFVLRTMNYPMAPWGLGLVLGDILDKSLRRERVLSDGGGLGPFFTRPISLVLWVTIVITVVLSFQTVRDALGRLVARCAAQEPDR